MAEGLNRALRLSARRPELADAGRELLPAAHIVLAEDGPLSRPDIFAGIVRGATSAQAGALSSECQR